MEAIEILIADSLAKSLTAHTFPGVISRIQAVRKLVPDFQGEDVTSLRVSVVPGPCEVSNHTHGADLFEMETHVVVAKRIDDDSEIDDLIDLRSNILDAIRSKSLPPSSPPMPDGTVWQGITNQVTFDRDQITGHRVFVADVTVTYRRAQAKV